MNLIRTYNGFEAVSRTKVGDYILEVVTLKRSKNYASIVSKLKPIKDNAYEILNSEIIMQHNVSRATAARVTEMHKIALKHI